MLIDTNQIVSLSDLRFQLGRILAEVEEGKVLLVSKKGDIKAAFVPMTFLEQNAGTFKEMLLKAKTLRQAFATDMAGKKAVWNSTALIRTLRNNRVAKMKKLAK